MKKIVVLFGNYGSGKTELSLNIALEFARKHDNVTLVDLDIVNPYFRSSEHTAMLQNRGIRVVAPVYANTAVDLPALPPDVYTAFQGGHAVLDCGGDPVGASALGSLKRHIDAMRSDTEALFVVNPCRPFQNSVQALTESLARIQNSARLTADGFVLNANMGTGTTGRELSEGLNVVQRLSQEMGIPLAYVSGTPDALAQFNKEHADVVATRIALELFTRPEWL